MPVQVKDLKNCFLVAFKVSVHGGISYKHSNEDIRLVQKREESEWLTNKVVNDKEEYNDAQSLRGIIKRSLDRLGRTGELGTIVPVESEEELDKLIAQNRERVQEFNAKAGFSNMRFSALKFHISGENEVALTDMLEDLRDTLEELRTVVQKADYTGIRGVVAKLQGFDAVLPPTAADYLQRAVADARVQAREAKKLLERRGEDLGDVQAKMSTSTVDFARFAVMDPQDRLEVDNELVQKMMAAQAATRTAGLELGEDTNILPFAQTETRSLML